MNMTPKIYFFERKEDGLIERIAASSLAEATGKLPEDYFWDAYWTHDMCQSQDRHRSS